MSVRFMPMLVAILVGGCEAAPQPSAKVGDEASLRKVDERQRALIVARDTAGLQELADPDLHINAPSNRVVTGSQLVDMMKSGAVGAEDYVRVPEKFIISGDIGIVMGRERFTPTPESEAGKMFGSRPLDRRYTNVFRWKDGQWRHLARHVNVVPSTATQTPR